MIFISYSRNDIDQAKLLQELLLEKGYKCHQVFRDDDPRNGIVLGERWETSLLNNLKGIQVLIVLVSPSWYESKWCFAELVIAKVSIPKPAIIPIQISELKCEQWLRSGIIEFQGDLSAVKHPADIRQSFEEFVTTRLLTKFPPNRSLQLLRDALPDSSHHRYKTMEQWAADPHMLLDLPLILGEAQRDFQEQLRKLLQSSCCPHVHIVGPSGAGKTRLVLETLRQDMEHTKLAVYYDHPAAACNPTDSFFRNLIRSDSNHSAIVVVDDCLRGEEKNLAQLLSPAGGRVTLLTLSYEPSSESVGQRLECPVLESAEISQIIASHLPPGSNVAYYAQLCEGSARFAHLVGQCLKYERDLHELTNQSDLLTRVLGYDDGNPSSPEPIHRLTIARFLALFDRIGVDGAYSAEVNAVVDLIQLYHPSIGLGETLLVVDWLRQKRILQGKHTVYFSAKLMQIILWHQWWDCYGAQFTLDQYTKLKAKLQSPFVAAFRYIESSERTSRMAIRLLTDRAFWDGSLLEEESIHGGGLFRCLAEFAPTQAVDILFQLYRRMMREETDNRSLPDKFISKYCTFIVKVACRRRYQPAIQLLKHFAIHNSELTRDYLGHIYRLDKSPEVNKENLKTLRHYLRRSDDYSVLVGRICVDAIRATGSKNVASDAMAVEHIEELWMILQMAGQTASTVESQKQVVETIGQCLGVLRFKKLLNPAKFEDLNWLAERSDSVKWVLVEALIGMHEFSLITNELLPSVPLQALFENLLGSSLLLRLSAIGAIEERQTGESKRHLLDVAKELSTIALAVVQRPDLLRDCLTVRSRALSHLGMEIGRNNQIEEVLIELKKLFSVQLKIEEESGLSVLASYCFSEVYARDKANCLRILRVIANDSPYPTRVLELLTNKIPFDADIVKIAENLISNGASLHALDRLDRTRLGQIDDITIANWAERCIGLNTSPGLTSACSLLHDRINNPSEAILEAARDVISCETIFASERYSDSHIFFWFEIFKCIWQRRDPACYQFIERYWLAVAKEGFGRYNSGHEQNEAAELMLKDSDLEAWYAFFRVMETTNNPGRLMRWVSHRELAFEPTDGYWRLVPLHLLYEWIDRDCARRIPMVCFELPPLVLNEQVHPVSRKFLCKYFDQHDACREWLLRVLPQHGWYGNLSSHYNDRISELNRAVDAEEDPKVKQWIIMQIDRYTEELERTRVEEEVAEEHQLK